MRAQFWKGNFWESSFDNVFENVFFEKSIFVGWGTSLEYLPPLGKSSIFLGRVEWEVFFDQWHEMTFHKSHRYGTVSGRVPKVSWLIVFGKKGWIEKLAAWEASK